MSKVAAPAGLNASGSRLWSDLVSKYDFRVDELAVLERACRASDRISAMESALGDQVTTAGSMGQVVVHPLIGEIRAHTALVAALLRQLAIPDGEDAAGVDGSRSVGARKAAQSRWAAAHGAPA